MVRHPVTVDADSTIGRFMDDVAGSHRFTTYPVLDRGRPVGLLAFASVASVPRAEWDTRRVRDTMFPLDDVPLLTKDELAVDALQKLSAPTGNRGLVVDDGHLAGVLSSREHARAAGEPRARGGRRPPGRAPVDHRHRTSARSRPEPGPGTVTAADVTNEMTSTSVTETIKQVDAGVLNVGYAEAGPADGLAVLLLHG